MKVKKMSEKKLNYTIVDKNGNVVENVDFNDYDKLADHMLDMADKWYEGVYDPDDKLEISTFNESGEIVYKDTATFGETFDGEYDISNEFELSNSKDKSEWKSGEGFGKFVN
jgi:hypothetical protein